MANRDQFKSSLRAAVRGLWLGALSQAEALDSFRLSLAEYLTRAWAEGIARYDLTLDDLSPEEAVALETFIAQQRAYAPAFLTEVAAQSKAHGGALAPLFARVDLWVNRYDEALNLARMMADRDQALVWNVTAGKLHCRTCGALKGWVKRASYWLQFYEETGVRPKSRNLECHGFLCGCSLDPTRRPLSKGRPPVVA